MQEQFQALRPAVRLLAQRPGMSEAEREAFLAAFAAGHPETLVGFAVMGGIFGEGIDLAGERLIGAIIVGVGLPQLCLERDLIRGLFQENIGSGFDYAYTYPGMNRVLQATGRVIRSETDCGVVLLIEHPVRRAALSPPVPRLVASDAGPQPRPNRPGRPPILDGARSAGPLPPREDRLSRAVPAREHPHHFPLGFGNLRCFFHD